MSDLYKKERSIVHMLVQYKTKISGVVEGKDKGALSFNLFNGNVVDGDHFLAIYLPIFRESGNYIDLGADVVQLQWIIFEVGVDILAGSVGVVGKGKEGREGEIVIGDAGVIDIHHEAFELFLALFH